MPVSIKLSDFAKELGNLTPKQLAEGKRIISSCVVRAIPDLVKASPVDTGLYAQSWGFEIAEEQAILGNYAPYAGIIEYGARPHTPPLKPLLAWAKRVLGDGSQPPDYSPEVWRLALGVQKKIAAQGSPPKHILENELPKIIENIKREFSNLG